MSAGMNGYGFLGLDPLQALQRRAEDQSQGQTPAPAPAPAAASAAAPAGGDQGGGAMGFLGNLFSGKGFGGSQPGDDAVDPNTGATVGQTRQANIQGLQKIGLLLLSASGRMSNDSRAAIMSRLPEAMDNSAQLNSFAKARLQMAELRLKERQMAEEERKSAGWASALKSLGGGGGAAPAASAAAPSADQTAATAQAAAAAAGGDASALAPIAAPAAAAPAAGGAPGGAPAQPAGNGLQLDPQQVALLSIMDREKGLDFLLRRSNELRDQEQPGQPYVDPQTGRKMVDIFKHGQKVRSSDLGNLLGEVTEENGKRITRTAGTVTGIADVPEDPQDREERTASVGLRTKRFQALAEARPIAQAAAANYDRVEAAQKAVLADKTFTGLQGSDMAQKGINLMASLGMLSDEGRKKLTETGNVMSIFEQSGGEFAKAYYGPQISNSDVENARKAIGGLQSNQPEVVAAALGRIKDSYRQRVEQYDKDVTSHNGRLSGIRSEALRADLQVEPIGRRFDAQPQQQPQRQEAPQRQAAPAATEVGTVVNGYRYKGGPRGLQSSWERVN